MHGRPLVVVVPCLLVVLSRSPRSAFAQDPAITIEELQSRVKTGDRISATDTNGHKLTGKLSALSVSALTIHVKGSDRTIPASDLLTVVHHHGDSLKDGFAYGFLWGGGMLVLAGAEDPMYAVAFGATGCIGGLIGMVIDASIKTHQLVFVRVETAADSRLSIAPLVTHRTAGVQVTLTFAK